MSFDPDDYIVDVTLEDNFQTTIAQLPAAIQAPLKTLAVNHDRRFRQVLWTVFNQSPTALSSTVELLALACELVPASFKPRALSPSDVAMAKAKSYSAQYLYGQFVAQMTNSQLTDSTPITDSAAHLWLSMIARLQLNFNQRERVADYLKDAKARAGVLSALTCRIAAMTNGIGDSAVIDLIAAIGETLGVIAKILTDVAQTHDSLDFHEQVLQGDYPLSMLFAFEEEADWFNTFFHAKQKPTSDQFETARKLTIQAGEQSALDLANELINQTKLDAKALPAGDLQVGLTRLLDQLKQAAMRDL